MTEFKDATNRHLRHKLQSLGRRLDELEEATSKLQKAEDELLDLQDKIMQAEGSNSSLLGDVETLRKRVLKIEGKDEEVRKAEDLCRLIKEKLEEEEKLTKQLKAEIKRLQLRMTELEKLEEAFGKSKSDCTQLCLNLNEEKNLTKKLSAEIEALKARVKEFDSSEASLNRAEQALTTEMEKLKSLTQTFVIERKKLLEKQREDEKIILKLTEKLEHQKSKIGLLDHSINESHNLIIEDDLSAGLSSKRALKKKLSHDGLRNKSENEKNSLEGQEDNKMKDLAQEVEILKSRLKQLEMVEENLKNTESKNAELEEKFQQERSRSQVLSDQLEQLKIQLFSSNTSSNGSLAVSSTTNVFENGKAETEEINIRGGLRQEKKGKGLAASEALNLKYKKRDNSPQQLKLKERKELSHAAEKSPMRQALSPAHRSKKTGMKTGSSNTADSGLKDGNSVEYKLGTQATSIASNDKKVSVLSRYPPAASDQKPGKVSIKPSSTESMKVIRDVAPPEKDRLTETESSGPPQEITTVMSLSQSNGSYAAYRSHASSGLTDHGSEGHLSASETESVGSKLPVGEQESAHVISVLSGRTTDSKYPRYSMLQDTHSVGSSTRSSYDEDQHRSLMMEGGSQDTFPNATGIEIQRVCSPRESLCSKVLIKPAIIEYDRKEMMSGVNAEPVHTNEKPKIATKPNKMTSSITFYPNDPNSSRTSSRSSSVSSDPSSKERHTSTSNIVIGPNTELRGSITIPYEISIPKSEITLRSVEDDDSSDFANVLETARIETTILSRSSLNFQSAETGSELNNSESGFESSGSTTTTTTATTATSRRNNDDHCSSQEDNVPEMRNVTIRSAWRNRGAASVDQIVQGPKHDGLEDETEPTTTWRAYRATTVLDTEENLTPNVATRSGKPSPAERYMQKISSGNIGRESLESSRRNKSVSPTDSSFERAIAHEPVCAQQLQPRMRKEPPVVDESEPSGSPWRRQSAGEVYSAERLRARGTWTGKAGVGDGSRPWSSRHQDH